MFVKIIKIGIQWSYVAGKSDYSTTVSAHCRRLLNSPILAIVIKGRRMRLAGHTWEGSGGKVERMITTRKWDLEK
jgi:hypothetical protein